MSEPIRAGDLAVVVSGLMGDASPNIGLIVRVVHFHGEHSQYGRIWTCEAEYGHRGQSGTDKIPSGHLDFAQSWLKKIEPPAPTDTQVTNRDLEHVD